MTVEPSVHHAGDLHVDLTAEEAAAIVRVLAHQAFAYDADGQIVATLVRHLMRTLSVARGGHE